MESAKTGGINDAFDEWISLLPYNTWAPLPVSGSRPSPRYKHGSAVVNDKLYIVGGAKDEEFIDDIQVLDLKDLKWSPLAFEPHFEIPAISGVSVINWERALVLIGGKSDDRRETIAVRMIQLDSNKCVFINTIGKAPIARSGHSATLVGTKIVIFGGEALSGELLNDINILDLETMTWDTMPTLPAPPEPRNLHVAAVINEKYLHIFGGCSKTTLLNDFHIFDIENLEWYHPQVRGFMVSPRKGHASTTIGGNWYIAGGSSETIDLDLSKLILDIITRVEERNLLASEGLSLCSTRRINGENVLLAFGGYNMRYTDQVSVLRLKPLDSRFTIVSVNDDSNLPLPTFDVEMKLTNLKKRDIQCLFQGEGSGLEFGRQSKRILRYNSSLGR